MWGIAQLLVVVFYLPDCFLFSLGHPTDVGVLYQIFAIAKLTLMPLVTLLILVFLLVRRQKNGLGPSAYDQWGLVLAACWAVRNSIIVCMYLSGLQGVAPALMGI